MKIRIFRKHKDVPLPLRQTPHSAGLDVYVSERVELYPGRPCLVPTGLIIESPPGYFFKVHMRSGFALRNGVSLVNDVGIVDEDYCGPEDEVRIPLIRHYDPSLPDPAAPLVLEKGTRIAQIIFEKSVLTRIEWEEMDEPGFAGSSRGGFGSTGTH